MLCWKCVFYGILLIAFFYVLHKIYKKLTKKSFKGQNVLITGSAHGLGFSLAKIFVDIGCNVILWDINKELLSKAVTSLEERIKEKGLQSKVFSKIVDVTNYELIQETGKQIKEEIGDIDVLINNAGYISRRRLLDATPELIKRTFNVNVFAHFWTIKTFLPRMLKKKSRSHIVCICSLSGITGIPGLEDYSSSKFASFGLAENVALLVKKHNKSQIDVLTVCPTLITTGFNKDSMAPSLPNAVLSADDTAKIVFRGMENRRGLLVIPSILGTLAFFFKAFFDTWVFHSLNKALGGLDSMDKVYGIEKKDL